MATSATKSDRARPGRSCSSKYLGRQDIWNVWANQTNANPASVFGSLYWDQMVCPSDPPPTNQGQWLSYVVNCGLYNKNTNRANGVCFNQLSKPTPPTVSTDILRRHRKGSSYTLFGSENTLGIVSSNSSGWAQATAAGALQYTGFCWQAVTSPNVAQQINGDKANPNPPMPGTVLGNYTRPSSNHPGGVNVTFCDGHYHFLREVWRTACTRCSWLPIPRRPTFRADLRGNRVYFESSDDY